MTENEAIEKLHAYLECESRRAKIVSCNESCDDCELHYMQGTGSEHIASVETAIKALEEVQQYRKHGVTLESALNNMCDLAAAENLIEEYRAIGTPEECRAAMEKQQVFNMDKVVEQLEEACISPSDYPGFVVDIEKAIEIVKGGGVDGN